MRQNLVTIPKLDYEQLKMKAEMNDELLMKLVNGLEDIKHGRIKQWKRATG